MNYLFDTCVISEVIWPKPVAKEFRWLEQTPNDRIYLSVLTLGELRKGILRLEDPRKAHRLQAWLDNDVRTRFGSHILPVDEEVALEWGKLCVETEAGGHPLLTVDALLAVTAIVHHLTLVTRNTTDVAFTRADVFNPWE